MLVTFPSLSDSSELNQICVSKEKKMEIRDVKEIEHVKFSDQGGCG